MRRPGSWIREVVLVGLRDLPERLPRVEQPESQLFKRLFVTVSTADLALRNRSDRADPVDPDAGIQKALHVPRDRAIAW
jgi:hypothetical protein